MPFRVFLAVFIGQILLCIDPTFAFEFRISATKGKVPAQFTVLFGRHAKGSDVILDSVVVHSLPVEHIFLVQREQVGLFFLQIRSNDKGANRAEFIASWAEKNMLVETDYWGLMNGFVAISASKENEALADLLKVKVKADERIDRFEGIIQAQNPFDKDYKKRIALVDDSLSHAIRIFNTQLDGIAILNRGTYVANYLVPLSRYPDIGQYRGEYDSHFALMNEHFLDSVPKDEALLNHYALEDRIITYLDRYTFKSTDGAQKGIDVVMKAVSGNEAIRSFVYNLLLSKFIQFKTETLAKYLLDHYSDGCTLNLSVEEVKRLTSMRSLMIGGVIPELYLPDVDGKRHSLHEYALSRKFTVVFVWLSWCAMCEKQMPLVESAFSKMRKQGMGLFNVSLDEKREDWIAALERFGKVDHPCVSEGVPIKNSSVTTLLAVATTPKVYIINKDSEIVAKDLYGKDLEAKLEELFAGLK